MRVRTSGIAVVLSFLLGMLAGAPAAAQAAGIPTPESVLGFPVGADFKLATYDESIAYFRALDVASDHLQLLEVGRTSEGRPWYLAVISSPGNLRDLERYRGISQRLAHPAGLTDAEARRLAREGKAFVDISGGLHASEVAGAQHTMQLAHDLLTRADEPATRAILDEVVLFLWPSLNPDGQNIVVDWYRENVGTPYEVAPLHELYQKYVGHDNNRDAYMLNMVESRVAQRTWSHWEPQIIYVHHQTAPFPTRIWLPPFAEPIATRAPALMAREVNTIGMTIAQALESNGQVGATHMGTGFDAWYPGYIDYMPMLRNVVSYWTETALYRYATPHFYTTQDFPADMRDLRPQTLYSSPWPGGWWRLGDAVGYMETASIATLDYAAKYRETLLYNRYQAGRDAIRRYSEGPPYAYVVPQDQRDPGAAVAMLQRLAFNGVRVSQLDREARMDGVDWPRGTWVIPMDQEFSELVRQLMEVQSYPDLREYPGGPPEQPYDAAGWTLPLQMDVRVVEVGSPLAAEARAAMRPIRATPLDWRVAGDTSFATDSVAAGIVAPSGRITGSGGWLAVDPAQNAAFQLVGRALRAGGSVRYSGEDGGRYLVSGVPGRSEEQWAEDLALRAERTSASGSAPVRARVALYKPWTASMDAGWTQWLLEQHEIPFTMLEPSGVRAGGLRERFDVLILPAEPASRLLQGYAKGTVPTRYEGGLEGAGVRALDDFVRAGGTLVCLNECSDFAIQQLHLPVRNVVDSVPRQDFFTGGSILRVVVDSTHPVMAGMPERASIFVDDSPAFATEEGFRGAALAFYESEGSPLLSGYLLGETHIQGYAAALDVRHGEGHVLLIGFRPQWRGQSFGTFRVVLNAALFGADVAAGGGGSSAFWTSPPPGEAAVEAGGAPRFPIDS